MANPTRRRFLTCLDMFRRSVLDIFGFVGLFEKWQCQNLVPLVNIKIAGKWMFIPLKMVCIGIDP